MYAYACPTYRLWDKAQSAAQHHVSDHRVSRTVYQTIATDTGEITEMLAPVDPLPTHLASVVAPQLPNETGHEKAANAPPDFLAHSLLGG